jgi:hypothetical protein
MHPYFYRTGEVTSAGHFVVTRDLGKEQTFTFYIASEVGPFEIFIDHYRFISILWCGKAGVLRTLATGSSICTRIVAKASNPKFGGPGPYLCLRSFTVMPSDSKPP